MSIVFILQCQKVLKKQPTKLYEKSRFKRRSHHFQWCPLSRPCLYSCRFFYVDLYQRIYILVYYKQISSQCNLTTQIEPVQNKVIYQPLFEFEVKKILHFTVHSFLVQRGDVYKNKGQYTFR